MSVGDETEGQTQMGVVPICPWNIGLESVEERISRNNGTLGDHRCLRDEVRNKKDVEESDLRHQPKQSLVA